MSLDRRKERRRQARRYKPQSIAAILRSFHDSLSNQQPPVVNVAPVEVKNSFSPVMSLDAFADEIGKRFKDTGQQISAEIMAELAKPRKVVCDQNGEPIGTITVESL